MALVIRPVPQRSGLARPLLIIVLFLGLIVSSCLGTHFWRTSAPPLARTVELIERDPAVAEALGGPVSVSLAVSRVLTRDWLLKLRTGQDRVHVITRASGPDGDADLVLSADNHDDQGWVGTFSVTLPGRRVLRDGAYVTEDSRVLLAGSFDPDGTPRPR
jgi:hypothetical protein